MDYKIDTVDGHEECRKELMRLIGRYEMGKATRTPCDVLADMMLAVYDAYNLCVDRRDRRLQKPTQKAPCTGCKAAEQADDNEDEETNELGYILYRHGRKPGKYTVFVEWRDGIPLFARDIDAAMIFKYRGMAERVAEKLGARWAVIDLDEVEQDSEKTKRLLAAIFGEDEADD